MPNKLTDLEAVEVSLVGQGANKKKFLVFKSAAGVTMASLVEKIIGSKEHDELIQKDLMAAGLSEDAMSAVTAAMKILMTVKDELPPTLMAIMAKILGQEMAAPGASEGQPNEGVYMNYAYPPKKDSIQKMLSAVCEKMESLKLDESKLAEKAGLDRTIVEKWLGGADDAITKDQFVMVAKAIDFSETDYSNALMEDNMSTENTTTVTASGEATAGVTATVVADPVVTTPETKTVVEKAALTLEEVEKLVGTKVDEVRTVLTKSIEERDVKITSLVQEVEKLRAAPVAPASQASDSKEEIQKSAAKSVFAGLL